MKWRPSYGGCHFVLFRPRAAFAAAGGSAPVGWHFAQQPGVIGVIGALTAIDPALARTGVGERVRAASTLRLRLRLRCLAPGHANRVLWGQRDDATPTTPATGPRHVGRLIRVVCARIAHRSAAPAHGVGQHGVDPGPMAGQGQRLAQLLDLFGLAALYAVGADPGDELVELVVGVGL